VVLERIRSSVGDITDQQKIDSQKVGAALTALTARRLGNSLGPDRMAEDALKWTCNFLAEHQKALPLDGLKEALGQFCDSQPGQYKPWRTGRKSSCRSWKSRLN
jgi:hypothetical protein